MDLATAKGVVAFAMQALFGLVDRYWFRTEVCGIAALNKSRVVASKSP